MKHTPHSAAAVALVGMGIAAVVRMMLQRGVRTGNYLDMTIEQRSARSYRQVFDLRVWVTTVEQRPAG